MPETGRIGTHRLTAQYLSYSGHFKDGLRFRLVDSAYPNSDPKQFSDEDFDKGIAELLSLPLDW